jgi:hypothetical protein
MGVGEAVKDSKKKNWGGIKWVSRNYRSEASYNKIKKSQCKF